MRFLFEGRQAGRVGATGTGGQRNLLGIGVTPATVFQPGRRDGIVDESAAMVGAYQGHEADIVEIVVDAVPSGIHGVAVEAQCRAGLSKR